MDEKVGAKNSKSHGNQATRWAIFKRSLRRESRKMKLLGSAFKWKRLTNLQISFMDNILFKFVSVLEGVVLENTRRFGFSGVIAGVCSSPMRKNVLKWPPDSLFVHLSEENLEAGEWFSGAVAGVNDGGYRWHKMKKMNMNDDDNCHS
ncbi:hypothetical protein SDJN02_25272, partial [Cucurbita argyrosperma subsp. argyrosperma]